MSAWRRRVDGSTKLTHSFGHSSHVLGWISGIHTLTVGLGEPMSTDTSDTNQPGELGTLLRELRARAQRTQEELAELAGVSARLVSDLERGVIRRPRRDTVRMLVEALGLASEAAEAFTAVAHGRRPPAPVGRLVRGLPVP